MTQPSSLLSRLARPSRQFRTDLSGQPAALPDAPGEARGIGPARVLVNRGLCQFERVRRPNAAKRLAQQAILAQARRRSPFAEPMFHIEWGDEDAAVWSWDRGSVRATEAPALIVPESVLFEPMADGARLIGLGDGYEGQVWREGRLAASRWWPHAPAPAELRAFLRAAGAEAGACLMQIEADALRSPRAFAGWSPGPLSALVRPYHLAALALALLGAPLAYQGAQWASLSGQRSHYERALEQASAVASQSDAARLAAIGAAERAQAWAAFFAGDRVLEPLLELQAASGPLAGATIERITIEGDQLRLMLGEADRLDAPALIQALERGERLEQVAAEPGVRPQLLSVTGRIIERPVQPVEPASGAEPTASEGQGGQS